MRRTILGGLLAATIGLAAAALAKPAQMPVQNASPSAASNLQMNSARSRVGQVTSTRTQGGAEGSIGGGMQGGNEPGHITGPGATPIDTESRGPINDVDVGRGTNDVPQSRNPKPSQY